MDHFESRRIFLKTSSAAATVMMLPSAHAQAVPFSEGSNKPQLTLPAGATDCHHHIYDARYPNHPSALLTPPEASIADYRNLQARIGTSRNVIVQPSTYGFDNRGLVDALKAFGKASRGVAVVSPDVSDDELDALHKAGVRGLRINLLIRVAIEPGMIEPLARRIARRGWHLQIAASGDQIMEHRQLLERVQVPLVFDHLGLLPLPTPLKHPAFMFICSLLERQRGWVKLSGVYNLSKSGPPAYADYSEVARSYVDAYPRRLVWGSDWPHPTEKANEKPNDANLIDLLAKWVPDVDQRKRILVDQPAELYGF